MPLTPDDIKCLTRNGVIAIPREGRTPERWRVNGALKLWKRSPERFRLPVKHGLYAYAYIDEYNLDSVWNANGAYVEVR